MGSIVTHQNWRGQFARGTLGAGRARPEQRLRRRARPVAACRCRWPGWSTTAWHEDAAQAQTVTGYEHYWLGSLSVGMRDASGQMYMRNRYYNPQTGQFTQPDPIGLAGGLNSYGFAAGDPVTYSDPYGLCKKPKGQGAGDVGICVESYIASFLAGAGNGRGLDADGGGFKTSVRFTMSPRSGQITGRPEYAIGRTMGIIPGNGLQGIGVPRSDGDGGWLVNVWGSARQSEIPLLGNINFNLDLHIAPDGDVTIAGGRHDGYPSYEVWSYPKEGGAELVYNYKEGHLGELFGKGDVTAPDKRRP